MYTRQCKGCQMGQSNGVLLKEEAAISEVSFSRGFHCICTCKCAVKPVVKRPL